VRRTREGGAIALLDGHRMTCHDRETNPDVLNDEAILWSSYRSLASATHRRADTMLLLAQYLYAGETEPWENVRPTCTRMGANNAQDCDQETEPGSLYCWQHGWTP
jgi:hypothetical protein